MKLFGSIKELVSAVFRKDSQEITVRPNQSTTYTAARDIQLPPGDSAHVLTSATSTQTLTNKTIDGDDNTVQDLPVTAIKTVLGDADKVLLRDASGVPTSAKIVNANVDAAAAIVYSKLSIADGDLTIAKTSGLQTALDGKVDENAPITGATKTKITYDAKGLVTAGADLSASDLPTGIDAAKIADGSVDNTEFQKLGTAGTAGTGNLVTTDGTQVLTAKDIDGGTASNTSRMTVPKASTSTLAGLTRKEATIAYDTDLDKLVVDNGTTLIAVGSGSGAGEINAVLNASAADNTTGYTAGTSHTVTRVTTGSPMDPVIATAIQVAATTTATESSTSGGIYTISTMPSGLLNRKLKLEFYYTTSASQTWAVSVYRGGTRVPLSTDSSSVSALAAGVTGEKFVAYLDTDSSTSYTVNFTRTAGSGTTNLTLTNLIVGPGIQPQGSIVTPWTSYTPASTISTNVTWTGKYRRVGNVMEIEAQALFTGANSQNTDVRFSIPTGFTIDSNDIISTVQDIAHVGNGIFHRSSTIHYDFQCAYYDNNEIAVWASNEGDPAKMQRLNLSTATPFTPDSATRFTFSVQIPISEWAGSGTVQLAQNDVEYAFNTSTNDADDTSSFGFGPAGNTFPGPLNTVAGGRQKRVRFMTPIQVGDKLSLEIQAPSGGPWIEVSGLDTNTNTQNLAYQSTTTYGVGIITESINSTDVDVHFGRFRAATGATYNSTGTEWATTAGKWRLKKQSAGSAAGFGLATDSASGLVKKNRIQTKIATTNYTTSTTNIIVFNGLTVGRTYRLFMKASGKKGTSGAGNKARLRAYHNSLEINYCGYENNDGVAANDFFAGFCSETIFTAATTTVSIDAEVVGTGSTISGSTSITRPDGSMAILEELNDLEITTAFT